MAQLQFRGMLRAERDSSPLIRSLLLCSPHGHSCCWSGFFLPAAPLEGQLLQPSCLVLPWDDALLVKTGPTGAKVVARRCWPLWQLCWNFTRSLLSLYRTGIFTGVNAATPCFCSWVSLTHVLQCKPARRVGMLSRCDLFGTTEELR